MRKGELINLKKLIRTIPDWPKKGVNFRDVTTLFKHGEGFGSVVDELVQRYRSQEIDLVIGIESRGFILGSALAVLLGAGFVPVRKAGKLPAETESEEYELEYGKDRVEIHRDAINRGERVLLVDDLVATGGTALAACRLIEKLEGEVVECVFLVDLPDLGGMDRLKNQGYQVYSLIQFEGD